MPKYIPISEIITAPGRQRREFSIDAHMELKESIEGSSGLINAILLRGNTLVAGERRLRAITEIYELGGTIRHDGEDVPPGHIPYTDLASMDPLVAWQAELEENTHRVDLTWPEKAAATAEWMRMRKAQAEAGLAERPTLESVAADTRPAGGNPIADVDAVRKELMVARHLDDPEVKAAPTLKEAIKVIRKKEERQRNEELAAVLGTNYGSSKLRISNTDSREVLRETDSRAWSIVLCDPPYGIGADEFGDSGTADAGAHNYDDSYETWKELMVEFSSGSFKHTADNAHLYAFCDVTRFEELKGLLAAAGWKVFRTPLIWHNPGGLRAPWVDSGPQRKYECILFAKKGEKKVTSIRGDVMSYTRDGALGHFAQKPVGLLMDLLKRSAAPGDKVVDFFAGSGSTLEACYNMKLECDAFEVSETHYATAAARLNKLLAQGELPLT